ncbi:MAG: hypothetical protein ACK5QK_00125 [Chryseotalea sp.]|nr:hypothetical protein [Cytophagales bacterium]
MGKIWHYNPAWNNACCNISTYSIPGMGNATNADYFWGSTSLL